MEETEQRAKRVCADSKEEAEQKVQEEVAHRGKEVTVRKAIEGSKQKLKMILSIKQKERLS